MLANFSKPAAGLFNFSWQSVKIRSSFAALVTRSITISNWSIPDDMICTCWLLVMAGPFGIAALPVGKLWALPFFRCGLVKSVSWAHPLLRDESACQLKNVRRAKSVLYNFPSFLYFLLCIYFFILEN